MSVGTVTYPPSSTYPTAWPRDDRGGSARVMFTYTGPASYPTGGDTILAGQIKLGRIEWMPPALAIVAGGATGILFVFNYATGKLQAYWGGGAGVALTEVTAATDLSTYTALLVAEGRG